MAKKPAPSKSGWGPRIQALRQHLKLTRPALAKQLSVSGNTVARWERGTEEPSPGAYIKLGNIAGEPSCWEFWKEAGLYSGDFVRALPAVRLHMRKNDRPDLQIVHAGSGQRLFSKPQLHAIPLLPVRVAAYGHQGDKVVDLDRMPPEGLIAAPSHWAPNPAVTTSLRVRGDSMAPVLCDGYIIVIDTSENSPKDLIDKIVVAWHPDKGLTVAWLKLLDGGVTLVPQSTEYGSVALGSDKGWRIIAKVLWWIGKNG